MLYKVTYTNHDKGAEGGSMVRESLAAAEQTARLMQDCGYRVTIIEEAE